MMLYPAGGYCAEYFPLIGVPTPPIPPTAGSYRGFRLPKPLRVPPQPQQLPPAIECSVVLALPQIRPELFAHVAIERLSVEAVVSLEMAVAALASEVPVGIERRAVGAQLVIGLPEIGPSMKAILAIARSKKRS